MSAAITRIEPRELTREFTSDQLYVIRDQVARDLDDGEFALFIEVCKRSKLDPFRKQIYAIKRKAKDGSYRVAHQTGIDGFRVIAERSGQYEGQLGPFWCGEDGVWKDVWLAKGNPSAARIGALREGFREPVWAVARFSSYVQNSPLWQAMPEVMIAKCAEALALRKAFPEDLSGLYTDEEMMQADNAEPVVTERAKALQAAPVEPKPDAISPADRATFDSFAERFSWIAKEGDRKQFQFLCGSVKKAHLPKSLETELLSRAKATDAVLKAREAIAAEKAAAYVPKSDSDDGPGDEGGAA